jgi:Ca-activated chloride channel homolog
MKGERRSTLHVCVRWQGAVVSEARLRRGESAWVDAEGALRPAGEGYGLVADGAGWRCGGVPVAALGEGRVDLCGPFEVRADVEPPRWLPPRPLRRRSPWALGAALAAAAGCVGALAWLASVSVPPEPLTVQTLPERFVMAYLRPPERPEPAVSPSPPHPAERVMGLRPRRRDRRVVQGVHRRVEGPVRAVRHGRPTLLQIVGAHSGANDLRSAPQGFASPPALLERDPSRARARSKRSEPRRRPRARPKTVSTLAADVDTASFGLLTQALDAGRHPHPETVRAEELLNAFRDYADPRPTRRALALTVEAGRAPWAPERRVVRVALTARAPREVKGPMNIVVVLDRSGSMRGPRMRLVKRALRGLVERLPSHAQLTLLAFNQTSRVVWGPARPAERDDFADALTGVRAQGTTDGARALEHALEASEGSFIPKGVNQIVFLTDGAFNRSITEGTALGERLRRGAQRGLYLTLLGVGGRHDHRLQQIADKGNGSYTHLNSEADMARHLGAGLGALEVVARDVKLQVRFDPAQVERHRLVGYENRGLRGRDFRDDAVDGGEVGAGHRMTALYEVWLHPGRAAPHAVRVEARYQHPRGEGAAELAVDLPGAALARSWRGSGDLQFAAGLAGYAEALRGAHSVSAATLWLGAGVQARPTPDRERFLRRVQRGAAGAHAQAALR